MNSRYQNAPATRLRELMDEKKLTQTDVAEVIGKRRQSVSQYCLGLHTIGCDEIINLSKHFGVSADWLLGLTDTQTTNTSLRAVCDYLGIQEKAAELIAEYSKTKNAGLIVKIISELFKE